MEDINYNLKLAAGIIIGLVGGLGLGMMMILARIEGHLRRIAERWPKS